MVRYGMRGLVVLVAFLAVAPGAGASTVQTGSDGRDLRHGRELVSRFCAQCHAPPSPMQHSADQWPAVVSRMEHYMARSAGHVPTPEQVKAIEDYLEQGK